ncbi:hypothetical protein WKH57_01210 [Niallia taxi]|uniref:hypothetical protein n=1 Tax=Niallia taxi TaxID=2499688 RepID=UPI00317F6174
MFNKQSKRTYFGKIGRGDEYSYTANSADKKISSDEILKSIQYLYERDGEVVIDFIDDESIQVKSLKTLRDDEVESKLNRITRLIKNYVTDEG